MGCFVTSGSLQLVSCSSLTSQGAAAGEPGVHTLKENTLVCSNKLISFGSPQLVIGPS